MDEENVVPESTRPEENGELTDGELEEIAGGLTVVKNANCQSSSGNLNSVVTLEASLKI